MCTQSVNHDEVMVPLLTVAVGLGVAGALFAVPSVAPLTAITAGIFASILAILTVFVGFIGWAVYASVHSDSAPLEQRTGRSRAT